MSSLIRRTRQQHCVGHFVVTVELDPPSDDHNVEHHRELAMVTRTLIDTFNAHRLPATWGVSDPAFSAATGTLLKSAVPHEVAILGDANWVGMTAGRTRFARELERRVTKSRSVGIAVTSLIPRVESVERHIDLVVKQGITAVAGVEGAGDTHRSTSPKALHYGVWELPAAIRLPRQLARFLATWRLKRAIRRTATEAGTFHLVVDAPALSQDAERGIKVIAALVQELAELKKRGLARIETLSGSANRLSDVPAASPQRSILRQVA